MNKAKMRRECIKIARYVNHYGHIPDVAIGGWAAVRKMNHVRTHGHYDHVRRQQKRRFMHGYVSLPPRGEL
jgi:hypothetical protein